MFGEQLLINGCLASQVGLVEVFLQYPGPPGLSRSQASQEARISARSARRGLLGHRRRHPSEGYPVCSLEKAGRSACLGES